MSHFDALSWPRRTTRLTLRPATSADEDAVVALFSDEGVTKWLPRQEEATRDRWREGTVIPSTVIVKFEGRVIGTGVVRISDGWAQDEVAEGARDSEAELGWVLSTDSHGRGIGTELASELLNIAFELGARRVFAQCFADNVPSWRIMEKLGMRREAHHVRESLHRDLGWVDGYLYAILRDEYDARA